MVSVLQMNNIKIKNTTGMSNDTKVFVDGKSLDGITQIDIHPIKINEAIKATITIDLLNLLNMEIESKDITYNIIYGEKDICTPNCKGCESGIPSIQGCR